MAVIMQDREGNVTLWNGVAEQTFGWTAQEVLGRFPPFVPDDQHADYWTHFNRLLAGDRISGLERTCVKKNGEAIEIGIAASPVKDKSGRVIALMGLLQDISDRRKLEKEFQQAQKMEAVGRLAGGVAHDFNNLLTVISGYAYFLQMGLRPDDPNRGDVEEIIKAGQRAANLTRQLLAFSRQQILRPRALDCNDVVGGIAKMFKRLIGEDIDVVLRLEPELGKVMADPGLIEQVIMNLVVNSRDAMPSGGTITVETANVHVPAGSVREAAGPPAGQYVMLSVGDTGCGMDARTQARIFEPFFTTKEQGKGTGLGLATVYGIVKQSDGYVYVRSEVGKGTTFKIYLPRSAQAAAEAAEARPAAKTLRGSETILYVEDDEVVRKLIQRSLADHGYAVVAAKDAEEAMAKSKGFEGTVSLLLTDMVMPKMHGRELARRLALQRPEMKVVYMSGYTDPSVVQNGFLDEGQVFIQKPMTLVSLLAKIREVLDGRGGPPTRS